MSVLDQVQVHCRWPFIVCTCMCACVRACVCVNALYQRSNGIQMCETQALYVRGTHLYLCTHLGGVHPPLWLPIIHDSVALPSSHDRNPGSKLVRLVTDQPVGFGKACLSRSHQGRHLHMATGTKQGTTTSLNVTLCAGCCPTYYSSTNYC